MQNYIDEFENQTRATKKLQESKSRKILSCWRTKANENKHLRPDKQTTKVANKDFDLENGNKSLDEAEYGKMMEDLALEFLRVLLYIDLGCLTFAVQDFTKIL